jgi:molecular chaperone HscB
VDPFAALGIARSFDVDVASVEKTHRELSRALHPDKFVGTGAAERRMALAKAVEVNEAWRAVRDPIRRAEALLQLGGVAVGEGGEPKPTAALLMDMMEQREALADAKAAGDMGRVNALAAKIEERVGATERALSEGFQKGADASLVQKLGELRFYRRFLDEVSAIEDEIVHGAA